MRRLLVLVRISKLMMRRLAVMLLVLTLAGPALAVEPSERLADPALEARARALSSGLRCLVCQNETIDESPAPLAHDMRVLIRERLKAGDNDRQVIDFLVSRYGQFVLLKPPVEPATYALWFGPVAVLLLAGLGITVYLRRRRPEPDGAPPLSEAERHRLESLLAEGEG